MATLWITCKKSTETNKSTDNIKEKKEWINRCFVFSVNRQQDAADVQEKPEYADKQQIQQHSRMN